MLTHFKSLGALHLQALCQSLNTLCKRPWANGLTILVIAITLMLPALLWVAMDNLKQLTSTWERGGHISLYLKIPLSTAEENELLLKIRETEGVSKALLITAQQGLLELRQQTGMEEIIRYLPSNPLPAVIEVTPKASLEQSDKLEALYLTLKAYPGVDLVKFDLDWVQKLKSILAFLSRLFHGLVFLLGFAVIFIVSNTLRLNFHTRHEEIKVLKLIGAKNAYIARPFLYTGMVYGFAGSLLALLLLGTFLLGLSHALNEVTEAYQMDFSLQGFSLIEATLLTFFSILLGFLGAAFSLKGQLATVEA